MPKHGFNPISVVIALLYSLRGSYQGLVMLLASLALLVFSAINAPALGVFDQYTRTLILRAIDKVAVVNAVIPAIDYKIESMRALRKENYNLKLQNAMLRKQVENLSVELSDLKKLAQDLSYSPGEGYTSIATRVIGAAHSSDLIMINSGSANGVGKGNVVLNDDGVIGLVTEVFESYSQVRPIHDAKIRIPTISVNTRIRSIVRGASGNNALLAINPLTEDSQFEAGELIVTAGEGNLYPAGLVVGQVVTRHSKFAVASSINWTDLQFVRVLTQSKSQ